MAAGPLKVDPPRQTRVLERLLLALFALSLPLLNPWVRGDGVGYYAYARAPLIQHNLDFLPDYQFANDSFKSERFDESGRPRPEFVTRTGHLENHFTVGPAILWSPFLFLAHAGVQLARALGSSVPANGFSAPYRYAMALGTSVYGFLGLLLSFRLARRYVDIVWAFLATLGIWFASSLPVYMYFNPSWSHAHSAFSVALFLWYWDRTRENRSMSQWLLLGLITGLMLDVYYANVMILAVLVVEALSAYFHALSPSARSATEEAGSANPPSFTQLLGRHLAFGFVVCVAMIPTFYSRWVVYGGPFETGYLSIRDFLWGSPVLLQVLFSSNHGLFSWTPILLLSFIGLLLFVSRRPSPGLAFLAAAIGFYLFIAFYPDWAGISSYGNRFFVSLTSLFVIGLGVLLERFAALFAQRRPALLASSALLALFALWNLGLIYQWGTHLIPARGPISFSEASANQVRVVPQQIFSQLRRYLFRRGDLMRQIEQKDVEQLKKSAQP